MKYQKKLKRFKTEWMLYFIAYVLSLCIDMIVLSILMSIFNVKRMFSGMCERIEIEWYVANENLCRIL